MPTEPESPSVPALEIVVSPARVMSPATLAELLLLLRNAPASPIPSPCRLSA